MLAFLISQRGSAPVRLKNETVCNKIPNFQNARNMHIFYYVDLIIKK